jgi:hypothetical protein
MAKQTINPGDTLSGIAQSQNTTVDNLLSLNPNITNPNLIQAGASINIPDTIDVSQVDNSNQELVAPEPNTAPPLSAEQAFVNSLDTNLDTAQAGVDTAQSALTADEQSIQSLFEQLQGQGETQIQLENQAGIPQMNQELMNLSKQRAQVAGEFNKMIEGVSGQGRGITTGIVASKQSKLAKQQAIEVGALAAQEQAIQGNIDLAQKTIDRTIDLKYGDIERELEQKMFFYDVNRDRFSKAEQKLADAEKMKLQKQMSDIENAKLDEKQAQGALVNALTNGASQSKVNEMMQRVKNGEATMLDVAGAFGDLTLTKSERISNKIAEAELNKINQAVVDAVNSGVITEIEKENLAKGVTDIFELANPQAIQTVSGGATIDMFDAVTAPNKTSLVLKRPTGKAKREIQNYLSTVENMLDTLTIDTFAEAKERGLTFGAMSEGEWDIIRKSATKLAPRVIRGARGSIIGFTGTPEALKADVMDVYEARQDSFEERLGFRVPAFTYDNEGNIITEGEVTNEEYWSNI